MVGGVAATGIFAACMSVISFANPLLMGFYNLLMPRSVLAWKSDGGAGLRARTVRDTVLLGAVMCAFCIMVMLAGETVMGLLYPGPEYQGHGQLLAVLAFATLVSAVGFPASNALASMERPRPIAAVTGVAAAVNVVLVWYLMTQWGLLGAAYGILAANVVWTLGRWIVFLVLVKNVGCDRTIEAYPSGT